MIRAPLTSDRLVLRKPVMDDASRFVRLLNDKQVVEHLSHVPFPYTEEDAADFIHSATTGGPLDIGDAFVVEERSSNELIGAIGVRVFDLSDVSIGEVGYWLGRASWGRGLASEAVATLLPACFASGVSRATAHVNEENVASRRVLEKNGFRAAGVAELWMPARGRAATSIMMALAADEWRGLTADDPPILTVVAVALLDGDDRVLLAQRPSGKSMAGLWEFPGGKIQPGESPEAALIRELQEELGVDTEQSCLAPLTFASHRYDDFHLLMPLYVCRVWQGVPRGREGQQLRWVALTKLADMPMPPADIPLVAMLRDYL